MTASALIAALRQRGMTVATAESWGGGRLAPAVKEINTATPGVWAAPGGGTPPPPGPQPNTLAAAFTDIPGASDVFGYGLVTYSNAAKQRLLQVRAETLAAYGAVSEQTAREMAAGLLALSGADLALATTGVAGPGGGSAEKPVGLVYLAAGGAAGVRVRRCRFAGDRAAVRRQTVAAALELAAAYLDQGE